MLNETKIGTIDLDTLREIVRTPASRAEHIAACVREFVSALPPSMKDAFMNPPDGTKAHAVIVAIEDVHNMVLTTIAAAIIGENLRPTSDGPTVRALSDSLDGPDFDPDFKERAL